LPEISAVLFDADGVIQLATPGPHDRAAGVHAAQFVLGEMGAGGTPLRRVLAEFWLATG
jgi:hypothetical protein